MARAFFERRGLACGHLHCEISRESGDGDQLVRLQVFFAVTFLELNFGQTRSGYAQRQSLVTHHVVDNFEVQVGRVALEVSA